jgi:hypothetical protein
VPGRRDVHRDALYPEEEEQVLRQADAHPQARNAWDAWDGVRPDAKADAVHQARHPPWADGAGKSAGREQGGREQDECRQSERRVVLAEEWGVSALCKPDAAQSAAQSCVAQGAAAQLGAGELPAERWQKPQPAELLPGSELQGTALRDELAALKPGVPLP